MSPNQHTDFKFHPQVTQVGCYWGSGGHTELYLLEGERLAVVDTGVDASLADLAGQISEICAREELS